MVLLENLSSNDRNTLLKIMIFYSLLTYFLFPVAGLYIKKNKEGITQGMLVGSVVCAFLWFKFGSKMVKME
jgi:hypothetical protein